MGVGGQRHAPAAFTPGKDPVYIVQEAWWAPGPVWIGVENLDPTGIQSLDLPAHSESLYRLSYPGPQWNQNLLNRSPVSYPAIRKSSVLPCDQEVQAPEFKHIKIFISKLCEKWTLFLKNPNILLNWLNHSHQQVPVTILGPVSSATVPVDGISYRVKK